MTYLAHTLHTAPHFGWMQPVHAAIRQGGVASVLSDDFKHYLQQNESELGRNDDNQDVYNAGSSHYINLENEKNSPYGPYRPETNKNSTSNQTQQHADAKITPWPELYQTFSPDRYHQLLKAWQQTPLRESDLPQGTTVYDSILSHTNELIRALATPNPSASNDIQAQGHQTTLYHAGALSHYVADLTMPLHATKTFNWAIAPSYANRNPELATGIHAFIEGEVLTQADRDALLKNPLPPLHLTKETIKPYLLNVIQQTHLAAFQVFQANQRVVDAEPYRVVNRPDEFKAALRQELLPIVQRQILLAQQAYGALLSYSFREAQSFENAYRNYQEYQGRVPNSFSQVDLNQLPSAAQPLQPTSENAVIASQ